MICLHFLRFVYIFNDLFTFSTICLHFQVSEETSKSQNTLSLMPPAKNDKGVPIVVPIHPSLIQQISSVKLNMPRDIRSLDHRRIVQKSIGELKTEKLTSFVKTKNKS